MWFIISCSISVYCRYFTLFSICIFVNLQCSKMWTTAAVYTTCHVYSTVILPERILQFVVVNNFESIGFSWWKFSESLLSTSWKIHLHTVQVCMYSNDCGTFCIWYVKKQWVEGWHHQGIDVVNTVVYRQ